MSVAFVVGGLIGQQSNKAVVWLRVAPARAAGFRLDVLRVVATRFHRLNSGSGLRCAGRRVGSLRSWASVEVQQFSTVRPDEPHTAGLDFVDFVSFDLV